MDVPEDPDMAYQMFLGTALAGIFADAKARGVPIFDLLNVMQQVEFNAVEFMFPHFFLLPTFGAMSSYRIRPLTPETCFFEIWSLILPPEGTPMDTPAEPTILPYNSDKFPEIPRQDYANLPIQQLGLHNLEFMRLGKGGNGLPGEGMISNYQRLIDGYLAGLDAETLARGSQTVNSGFDATILDIGF
jgi:carnitine monooxygenase subunit